MTYIKEKLKLAWVWFVVVMLLTIIPFLLVATTFAIIFVPTLLVFGEPVATLAGWTFLVVLCVYLSKHKQSIDKGTYGNYN